MFGFGIVGCGRIADRHLASIAACPGGQLLALCDVREERMKEAEMTYLGHAGEKDGVITHYQDAADLFKDERIKAVVIATHSASHAGLARLALQSGNHVVIEKPMTLSMNEANELVDLAESKGLLLHVCHQLRYKPLFAEIRTLISSGAMGNLHLGVVSMRLQRDKSYYDAAPWRGTWDQDGGMLLNQGIHLVDLLQWFMGDYQTVYGTLQRGPLAKQTEDVAAGVVSFKQGGIGVIEANTLTYPNNFDNSITLFGEKGTVSIGGIRLNEIRRWSFADSTIKPPEAADAAADEHLLMYQHIVQKLGGKTSAVIEGRDGLKALELIFAVYDAYRTGQIGTAPLTDFSTSSMSQLEGWS